MIRAINQQLSKSGNCFVDDTFARDISIVVHSGHSREAAVKPRHERKSNCVV